ncbi:hypothetical protein [Streptomyces sp. H27-D2]|uniref:hypothetical protein n=1 Tax=Streptomyces sp. H27-D2 TaxID=3046304 RepID=UPI002DB76F30|nr:hypothetical protein [Streptomyces sp. H27-D2]MEC4020732.1 hypothetical protein [Streptomyces sp. H27-D2]
MVGAPDERLSEVGVAYLVPEPGQHPDPAEPTAWTRERLANFKVPRRSISSRSCRATPAERSSRPNRGAQREKHLRHPRHERQQERETHQKEATSEARHGAPGAAYGRTAVRPYGRCSHGTREQPPGGR